MEQTRSWIQYRRVWDVPIQPYNQIQTHWLDLSRIVISIAMARARHLILSYWMREREREHCVRSCPTVWQQCSVLVSFDAAPTYLFSETNKYIVRYWTGKPTAGLKSLHIKVASEWSREQGVRGWIGCKCGLVFLCFSNEAVVIWFGVVVAVAVVSWLAASCWRVVSGKNRSHPYFGGNWAISFAVVVWKWHQCVFWQLSDAIWMQICVAMPVETSALHRQSHNQSCHWW